MSRAHELHGFLPDDYVELKTQRRTNVLWAMIFLVVAGGIGWAYFIAQNKVERAELENRTVNEQFAAAAKPIADFNRLQEEQQKLNRQAELAHSLVEKVNRSNLLAELTNSLPKNVYLVDLSLEGKRKQNNATIAMSAYERARAAKTAAKGVSMPEPIVYDVTIRLKGLAFTDQLVVDYMNNLARSPLFEEVNFVSTEEHKYKDFELRSFVVDLVINPAADTRGHAPLTETAQSN